MPNVPNYTKFLRQIGDPGLTADAVAMSAQVEALTLFINQIQATPPQPVLTRISPEVASPGDTLVLSGLNLLGASLVQIGNVSISDVRVQSATRATVVLPAGITSGEVRITTPGGVAGGQFFTKFNAAPQLSPLTLSTTSTPAFGPGVTASISATDADGIRSVEFQRQVTKGNGGLSSQEWESLGGIGQPDPDGIFRVNFSTPDEGTFPIRAKATDTQGSFSLSNVLTLTVTPKVLQSAIAPSIVANDQQNTVRAFYPVGLEAGESAPALEINVNNTGWQPYDGSTISVGNVTRVQGYYRFRTKGVPGQQLESAVVSSPEFTANTSAPPSLAFLSPSSGSVGQTVNITGSNLVGVTAVTLNGQACVFSATGSLTFTVPAGASSGLVVVTAAGGLSNGVSFTIAGTQNQAPQVQLTAPGSQSLKVGQNVNWSATGQDGDGSLQNVQLLVNGSVAQTVTSPPYQGTYVFTSVGTFQLAVRATDNQNLSTTSGSVSISVTPAVATYNTTLTGPSDSADIVTLTSVPELLLRCNTPLPNGDPAPAVMLLFVGNEQVGQVDYNGTATGQACEVTLNGVIYRNMQDENQQKVPLSFQNRDVILLP